MLRLRALLPLVLFSLLASACGTPREVAVVTERPAPRYQARAERDSARLAAEQSVAESLPQVDVPAAPLGQMYLFESPETERAFARTYGIVPDTAWYAHARRGALRFGGNCSASFVSPRGLVMTNHHCAREHLEQATRRGENLVRDGFVAQAGERERRVAELEVEQLVAIEDVTSAVLGAAGRRAGAAEYEAALQEAIGRIQSAREQQVAMRDSSLSVQLVRLAGGTRFSLYTYRTYDDVRLVLAPEESVGFFGGDADNFTFPRYTFDAAFFRVYAGDAPLESPDFFAWNPDGAAVGQPVFVVGSPGTTLRLTTADRLDFLRSVELPLQREALGRRIALIDSLQRADPAADSAGVLQNLLFGLQNTDKSAQGEIEALAREIVAQRRELDRMLADSIAADADAPQALRTLFREVENVQRSRRAVADQTSPFTLFASTFDSALLTRATYAYFAGLFRRGQAPQARIDEFIDQALAVDDQPESLDRALLTLRLQELQDNLGARAALRRVLDGRTIPAYVDSLFAQTALADSAAFDTLLRAGRFTPEFEPAAALAEALVPIFRTTLIQESGFDDIEAGLQVRLAQATSRYADYPLASDATFTLRISDGNVRGYETPSGAQIDPFTRLGGLFARAEQLEGSFYDLPDTWLALEDQLDASTPLNLVSTNDITGGNSGSPLLDRDLRVVGLVFDSNYEALGNDYLYRSDRARAISVDVRAMIEVLRTVYGADRLLDELLFVPAEEAVGAE
jgi:hypothetical protein